MFDLDFNTIVTAAGIVAVPIGWVVKRQVASNEKVTELDKQNALVQQGIVDLKELINTRFDSTDQRLERVERKVLNGDYHK